MSLSVLLLIVHVCLALAIITLILLQKGAGASAGAAFGGGGGGAGSIFGASGSSNFLSKTTAILATGFFLNSLALAYLASNREAPTSVVDMLEPETSIESVEAPALAPAASDFPLPTEGFSDSDVPPAAE